LQEGERKEGGEEATESTQRQESAEGEGVILEFVERQQRVSERQKNHKKRKKLSKLQGKSKKSRAGKGGRSVGARTEWLRNP